MNWPPHKIWRISKTLGVSCPRQSLRYQHINSKLSIKSQKILRCYFLSISHIPTQYDSKIRCDAPKSSRIYLCDYAVARGWWTPLTRSAGHLTALNDRPRGRAEGQVRSSPPQDSRDAFMSHDQRSITRALREDKNTPTLQHKLYNISSICINLNQHWTDYSWIITVHSCLFRADSQQHSVCVTESLFSYLLMCSCFETVYIV